MNRIFECLNPNTTNEGFCRVPDQTLVNAFLNPNDATSGLPPGLFDGLAIAAGQIDPNVRGNIAVHPFIYQVTLLLEGELRIHMKDPLEEGDPYVVHLCTPASLGGEGFTAAAALTRPGTFFQLDNSDADSPARVLYISSPSYVYEPGPGAHSPPRYDDAVQLGNSWDALAKQNWNPTELHSPMNSFSAREAALQRLAQRS
ncbi:MAG: hypothetical protein ACR2PZ_22855 [Pseudomonadales bacterium]